MTHQKRESALLNIGCNVVVPSLILFQLTSRIGEIPALLLALSFPFGYGVFELWRAKKWNPLSIVALVGIMLTGGVGLLRLPAEYIAYKEALIPTLAGIFVGVTAYMKKPLIRTIFAAVVDLDQVERHAKGQKNEHILQRTWRYGTLWLAATFFLSAVLNFVLAKWLVYAAPGTEEFNMQLGQMNLLSLPVIVVPSMAATIVIFFFVLRGITRSTKTTMEELLHPHLR